MAGEHQNEEVVETKTAEVAVPATGGIAVPETMLEPAQALEAATSGAGGEELPPFKLPRSETVYWTATGGIFQIFSSGFTGIDVNSQARSGSTYAPGGIQNLQINTTGTWTLRWKS